MEQSTTEVRRIDTVAAERLANRRPARFTSRAPRLQPLMNRRGSPLLVFLLGALGWASPGTAQTAPTKWLSYNAATKTVTFALQAGAPPGPGAAGAFNFNGYGSGAATLVVPPGATVVMNFVNLDGTPHSAEIIADRDPMPSMGGPPAIPSAYTKDLTQGMPQGGTDVMRFTAPSSGSFRIFCGVPGHGASGMWIRFDVDPKATAPSWVAN